jgi:hypothetical protein
MNFAIHQITSLAWPFRGEPYFNANGGDYPRQEQCDPFPCYAHPVDRVRQVTELLNEVMPLSGSVDVYLPAFEDPGRTNGWASQQSYYKDKTQFGALITLSGKRIPLHPAMTRYLMSHEYGHVVQYWVEHTFGLKNLIAAYAKDIRGYEHKTTYYGGKTWHEAPGEIFANDFRCLVARQELEFWPHEVMMPIWTPKACGFWDVAMDSWEKAITLLPSLEKKSN